MRSSTFLPFCDTFPFHLFSVFFFFFLLACVRIPFIHRITSASLVCCRCLNAIDTFFWHHQWKAETYENNLINEFIILALALSVADGWSGCAVTVRVETPFCARVQMRIVSDKQTHTIICGRVLRLLFAVSSTRHHIFPAQYWNISTRRHDWLLHYDIVAKSIRKSKRCTRAPCQLNSAHDPKSWTKCSAANFHFATNSN